jgi:hypothetical protein
VTFEIGRVTSGEYSVKTTQKEKEKTRAKLGMGQVGLLRT